MALFGPLARTGLDAAEFLQPDEEFVFGRPRLPRRSPFAPYNPYDDLQGDARPAPPDVLPVPPSGEGITPGPGFPLPPLPGAFDPARIPLLGQQTTRRTQLFGPLANLLLGANPFGEPTLR